MVFETHATTDLSGRDAEETVFGTHATTDLSGRDAEKTIFGTHATTTQVLMHYNNRMQY